MLETVIGVVILFLMGPHMALMLVFGPVIAVLILLALGIRLPGR